MTILVLLFGVIGDPIHHTMSPLIHNEAFKVHNIDAHYTAFEVKIENLEQAMIGFKAMNIAGFNVTVPHKQTIIPFLDGMDELAKKIGAVNTVVNNNGKWIGYNTDGPGFIEHLKNLDPFFYQKKILIIGSGGAARAIYYSLGNEGCKQVDIANRTLLHATNLMNTCPFHMESKAITLDDAENSLYKYDILVQTTNVGMHPNIHETPIQLDQCREGTLAIDIIYNPFETQFMKEAKKRKATIANGLDMLVNQAALSFELWTGETFHRETAKIKVIKHLGG